MTAASSEAAFATDPAAESDQARVRMGKDGLWLLQNVTHAPSAQLLAGSAAAAPLWSLQYYQQVRVGAVAVVA
jgi:hypothetical protein